VTSRLAPWLGLVVRLVVGGVWIAAGAVKIPDPGSSVEAVRAYQALPPDLVAPVGQLLPVVEVVVGLMLVLGLLTRGAGAVSAVLQVVFIIGIISVWVRGMDIDCGCFGGGGYDPEATDAYKWEVLRDSALLAGSLFLVWLRSSPLSLDSQIFRPRPIDQEA
jgi:uncharacterized membrane protein YphA (DoxX/SURF4 family)